MAHLNCPAGIALKIFLLLLPMILTKFSKLSGCQSLGQIDFAVAKKFFLFQVGAVACMPETRSDRDLGSARGRPEAP